MTQEEKEILLKDLSARLPYKIIVNAQYKDGDGLKTEDRKILGLYKDGQVYLDCVYTNIDCIKPYLRPMSSMTEEEKEEYGKVCELDTEILANHPMNGEPFPALYNSQDWLNVHHFDFRGLIEKGLALEAPEDMYKTK